ncbi:MAG: cobalamin adenosyltransferase [Cellulosilyticaceae bacterium]
MSVLTESDVRRMMANGDLQDKKEICVSRKEIITPSARAYLGEKNINIMFKEDVEASQVIEVPVVVEQVKQVKIVNESEMFDTLFGAKLEEKPEHMTHLRGNLLVFKDHPRIAFRGKIDSLEAEILIVQILAEKEKMPKLISDLEEVLRFVRNLLRCEVSGEPVGEFKLQDLTAEELREHSHHPSKYYGMRHFLPNYKTGEMVVALNKLRTLTRETELVAYKAFANEYGQTDREDIIKAFNRLSSLFWIMMFKFMTDKYK